MFLPIGDRNRTQRFPLVTGLLCFACIFVWGAATMLILGQSPLVGRFLDAAFIARDLSLGQRPERLVTAMFLHLGWGHLVGNVLFLWTFGHRVEDALGHAAFALFYFVTGVAATLVFWATLPMSAVPMLGASGAVSGVMGAYLVGFFRERISIVILPFVMLPFRVPALGLLVVWVGLQAVLGLHTLGRDGPGTAYLAHVGGFACGAAIFALIRALGGAQPYSEDGRRAQEAMGGMAADFRALRKSREVR
jgi:membrane associated rhomboid family serine protease